MRVFTIKKRCLRASLVKNDAKYGQLYEDEGCMNQKSHTNYEEGSL